VEAELDEAIEAPPGRVKASAEGASPIADRAAIAASVLEPRIIIDGLGISLLRRRPLLREFL